MGESTGAEGSVAGPTAGAAAGDSSSNASDSETASDGQLDAAMGDATASDANSNDANDANGTANATAGDADANAAADELACAAQAAAATSLHGRDFEGQVAKTINGKTYILIGSEQQLRAIGSGKKVVGRVYKVQQKVVNTGSILRPNYKWQDDGDEQLAYAGDADLDADSTLKDGTFSDHEGGLSLIPGSTRTKYFVKDASGNRLDVSDATFGPNTGLTYSADANYIIFRDVDVSSDAAAGVSEGATWTPLMFSGTMLGAVSKSGDAAGTLWSTIGTDGTGVNDTAGRPTVTGVNVQQSGKLNPTSHAGVGFFGTITNKLDESNPFNSLATPAFVRNIKLQDVTVHNESSEVNTDQTLVSALLSGLGTLVDIVLAPLLKILTFGQLDISGLLKNLLTVRAADPSSLATGAFAGRVVGDVTLSACEVANVSVTNVNKGMTGGFVGYVKGETRYEILSQTLGSIVKLLSNILNIIPGLGLGDLITLLLDSNIIKAGELLPIAYVNPTVSGCSVSEFAAGETLGNANSSYAGGFAGVQIGAILEDCLVTSTKPYSVTGSSYVGGFVGLMRNDVMKGALSNLGVDLGVLADAISKLAGGARPQSTVVGSSVTADVTVTAGTYAGGFTGAMANSYAVNDGVSGVLSVEATGVSDDSDNAHAYAGGFTSIATVGWLVGELGAGEDKNDNLLAGVGNVLDSLLSSHPEQAEDLLSLAGVKASDILGAQLSGKVTVRSANDYAGGLVGKADGTVIGNSSSGKLAKLTFWKDSVLAAPAERSSYIKGLASVVAAESYAGGIAGKIGVASGAGLVNATVGVATFMPFAVENFEVEGIAEGYAVSAGADEAGGAFGEAVGGDVSKVNLTNVASVSANNYAGGFAGTVGPGSLANTDGLDLLGLGLIKANNLLSLGEGLDLTVEGASVAGIVGGVTVTATGAPSGEGDRSTAFVAGGFVGRANSVDVTDAHVTNLKYVTAANESGYAGGFVGVSQTGGLAEVSDDTSLKALISAGSLLGAVKYLIPSYLYTDVSYVDGGYVQADIAGGYAGDLTSGKVNDDPGTGDAEKAQSYEKTQASPYAVYNIDHVAGSRYAGGFGGRVVSGGLAGSEDSGGLSILGGLSGVSISANDLLSIIDAYVPLVSYAGVSSQLAGTTDATTDDGFTVSATTVDVSDGDAGTAGGFIGYAAGAQVSNSDVTRLRHTGVTEPSDLEVADAPSYFNGTSSYAVTGATHAGGYVGLLDVGDAASIGGGLKVLGKALVLDHVLSALSVVVSTIEHSDVEGTIGGFAVLASGTAVSGAVGNAGGFAGEIRGGHIQDSNSYNFSYVIGQETAGGYVGELEPGDVANVLESTNILKGLLTASGSLASVAQDFVPTIRNSETTSIPCGGAVRAQAASDASTLRGVAGGYVGHNLGGHIWGNNTNKWKSENDADGNYNGARRTATAERIRSVYGAEMAGGFTGFMEPADTAKTGSLSLLYGLVEIDNLLGALQVAYPTEENTEVTGPVHGIDMDTWNGWATNVASKGYYGGKFAGQTFATQAALDEFLADYVYGTNVVAGRGSYDNQAIVMDGGVAGGYVGLMRGGTITNGQAYDTKTVSALRAAGGFAGRMETGGALELGSVKLLGFLGTPALITANLGKLVSALKVLVPVVKFSSVQGFRTGMTVAASGVSDTVDLGFAGGYVGYASGAQIWGDSAADGATATGCNVSNLRRVSGANCIGGFAGLMTAAGTADVNTNASDKTGLLQKILDTLISSPNDLASVLDATVSTVRGAHVSAVTAGKGATDAQKNAAAWGFTVDGSYKDGNTTKFARAAGGFAGSMKAVVAGTKDRAEGAVNDVTNTLSVSGLRGVEAGQYAGGFAGQADIESVASVAGTNEGDGNTSLLLGLLKAGNVSALDAFRAYIYHASVTGVADGFQVRAHDSSTHGILDSKRFTGAAGGFGGALINGSVKDSSVANLSSVAGVNYAGGFIGHLGKAGTVDAEDAGLSGVLGATAGVLDIWGSHVEDSTLSGVSTGYTVTATHGSTDYAAGTDSATGREVAGGFVGYADLARVKNCSATKLKKVTSGEVAGGFVGEAKRAYLVDLQASSPLIDLLLQVVNGLVKLLYLNKAQDIGLVDIGKLFPGLAKFIDLKVLADGKMLYVNLFGLKVGVALSKADEDNQQQTDVAIITIGDSVVKLPCNKDGLIQNENTRSNLTVQLIKGNRTRIENCEVTGIAQGYDVFGGGASQDLDGTERLSTGYAGGFAGLNDEGVLAGNTMTYADTIRGTSGLVDPFAFTSLKSVWNFNDMADIMGVSSSGAYNTYRIYRSKDESLTNAVSSNSSKGTGTSYTFASRSADDESGLDAFTVSLFKSIDASGKVLLNTYDGTVPTSGAAGDANTTWLGIKDAVRQSADGTRSQSLDAYVSAAKAVLMLDTAVTDNAGSLTPEPGEGQDPCDTYADLTLQKVWNDRDNADGVRPESVTIKVKAAYTDSDGNVVVPDSITRQGADGTTYTQPNPIEVTLTGADASNWSDTWRTVVSGLPVAFDDNGTPRYYSYTVTEVTASDDYTSSVTTTTNDFTATVTNTHQSPLPDTGGKGLWLIGLVAAVLIGAGGSWWANDRRRRIRSAGAAGRHFASNAERSPRAVTPSRHHARPGGNSPRSI